MILTKEIDLSKERFMESTINFFSIDSEVITDCIFGWSVSKAEINFEEDTGILLGYKLFCDSNLLQAEAKRITSHELEYWHYEYCGREIGYSPDIFQPMLNKFVAYFYKEIIPNDDFEKYNLTLPIVSYEIFEGKLREVRYALNCDKICQEPLFLVVVDKKGYIESIADWQTNNLKNTVLPTSDFPNSYLLQDFSPNSKNNGLKSISKCKEKELVFCGLHQDYSVNCLFDSDFEGIFKRYGFFINELRNIISDKELLLKYIPTINYHILQPCNMKCRHCFSDFEELGQKKLNYNDAKKIIKEIASIKSFKKLNFSGGEPTLFKGIEKLVSYAKELGIKELSLVSNGYKLSREINFQKILLQNLDILALSIDSFDKEQNQKIGRYIKRSTPIATMSITDFEKLAETCNSLNVKIKINTVVTKLNWNQLLIEDIAKLKPIRWKVLRMLPVSRQNDKANDIIPSDEEFKQFLEINRKNAKELGVKIVAEDNEDMTGSYLMISPDGKFFNNIDGKHNYSDSILDVGIKSALRETPLMREVFYKRDGAYGA